MRKYWFISYVDIKGDITFYNSVMIITINRVIPNFEKFIDGQNIRILNFKEVTKEQHEEWKSDNPYHGDFFN